MLNPDVTLILDLDWVKYSSASAGETRTLSITHRKSGKVKAFKNLTEFKGRSRKVYGGWLGEANTQRELEGKHPFTLEDFVIEIIQTPEALPNLLHTANMQIQSQLDAAGTNKVEFLIGVGESWRVQASTLLKYKDRDAATKPVSLASVSQYLINKYKPTVCVGLEADDVLLIRSKQLEAEGKKAVVSALDKDTYGCQLSLLNPKKHKEGIVDCRGFGKLWIEGEGTNKKVKGFGDLFLFFQTISEDTIDNYKLNCFSETRWGQISAYEVLVDCEDQKEALEVMIDVAKKLYPAPKVITGWRGNEILIDWLYVLRECFLMARMREYEHDARILDDWFVEYGVEYTYE